MANGNYSKKALGNPSPTLHSGIAASFCVILCNSSINLKGFNYLLHANTFIVLDFI